ncbi:MAG: sialate O-acetylesterase [Ruminococcus sp.]|nr:sialate O-acetylesterase [Ruminococcus sp.]
MKAAPVFSDNMVLQRGRNVRIFGTLSGSESAVTVRIPELGIRAEAVISGRKWEAVLPPMEACDCCTVELVSGAVMKIFRNVAVGEVWLCGGQSNMEYELHNDKNGTAELKDCARENVRFFYTPKCPVIDAEHRRSFAESRWDMPSEDNSRAWSAVGWYFAKELSRKLGVTVGLIGCNWGGTSASAWVRRGYLMRDERLRPYIDEYESAISGKSDEEMLTEYDEYVAYHKEWEKRVGKCYAERPDIDWNEVLEICGENRYPGPMGIKNPMRPCGLHDTMIDFVRPYTLAGVLWYQGESDDHHPEVYDVLLSTLIGEWREEWHDIGLPFMIVQLPMFRYETEPDSKKWAAIRDAQMKVFRTVKNTGLAVALDCGELNNIHPADKSQIGHRLYLQALSEVYRLAGRKDTLPPVFSGFTASGNRAVLRFTNCRGFEVRGSLSGFEAAGPDGVFVPAEAEISGCEIVLTAGISPITAVRYKWTNYAGVELFGTNGIPVPPFTTASAADN